MESPVQTKKPRVFLKNLTEEQRLQKIADSVQARRDYIKAYYKENEAYRLASKERARNFSKNYYHSNTEYKETVKVRSKLITKLDTLTFNEVSMKYISSVLDNELDELLDPQNL